MRLYIVLNWLRGTELLINKIIHDYIAKHMIPIRSIGPTYILLNADFCSLVLTFEKKGNTGLFITWALLGSMNIFIYFVRTLYTKWRGLFF